MKNDSVLFSNLSLVGLHLYCEIIHKLLPSQRTTHPCASHIDTTTLVDGTYELVPESESEQREVQLDLTEATEDPNSNPEEPKTSYAQEGKPRSMSYYFKLMQLIIVPIYLCIRVYRS